MLRWLKLLEPVFKELNIPFFLLKGNPDDTIPKFMKDTGAGLLVVDQSPVRLARRWREEVLPANACSSARSNLCLFVIFPDHSHTQSSAANN